MKFAPERFYSSVFSLLFLAAFNGCSLHQSPEKKPVTVPVQTMIVQSRTMCFPIVSTGILSKKSEMKLSFKTGGLIAGISADEGTLVHKNDVLAELNLAEIQAHATQASQALKKAQRDFVRMQNLYHDSVATLEQLQNIETVLQVARSNDRIARFNLTYSIIKAPSDGRILKRLAEPHEIIGAGHPVFLFAANNTDWVIRCNLPDIDRVEIHFFDSARIWFDAFPGVSFNAAVSELGDLADPYTGTFEVELRLNPNTGSLVSGLIGTVNIYPSKSEKLILIPAGSLVMGKGKKGFVYKVVNKKAVMQQISFSRISGDSLAVKEGLKTGDEVITEGSYFVDNSSEIKIVNQ